MTTRVIVEYGPDALAEAGRRLLALDPERFLKVLSLCLVYVSIYEKPPVNPLEILELCSLVTRGAVGG
jgi:hypothetical protein